MCFRCYHFNGRTTMKRLAILAILIISMATVFPAYATEAQQSPLPSAQAKERVDQLNGEFQGLQMQLEQLKAKALDFDAKVLGERIQAIQKRAAEIQTEAKPLLEQLKPAEAKDSKKDAPKKK